MSGTTITLEQLEFSLTKMRDEISKQVPALVKAESDVANKDIATLKATLEDLNKGLGAVQDQIKKSGSFGLPGSGEEKYKGQTFSITKFARALLEAGKMARGMLPSGDPWAHSQLEQDICKQYMEKRDRDLRDGQAIVKDYGSTDGSSGGFLIPPEVTQQIIDTVWPQMPIMNLPVMKIEGLRGELPVPSITSKALGYHVGENGRPAKSEGALGLRWLRPKKVAAFSKQSQRLLYQTSGVSDKIISYLLSQGLAVEFNRGLTNGAGSNSEPKGLLQYAKQMTTLSSPVSKLAMAVGTNGGRFTIDNAAQMQSALAAADELRDTPTYGFLMRPEVLWGMKRERVTMYSGGSAKAGLPVNPLITLMSDEQIKNALGYPFKHTTQIPATNSKGTSTTCSSALFGDWSLFWTAFWRDLEFKVSDVAADGTGGSAFLDDQLYMVAFQEYDCQLMRETAFSIIQDCETNESNW